VVREQVAMYGTLTGASPARPAPARSATAAGTDTDVAEQVPANDELAKILKLPAKRQRAS